MLFLLCFLFEGSTLNLIKKKKKDRKKEKEMKMKRKSVGEETNIFFI